MAKNRTIINVVCSILVLASNMVINFWLSPFIIRNIGVEANGFVALAGNFTSYATLLVAALNSMAARFISIEYSKNNREKANVYYNSVFWGNLIIVAVLLLPAVYMIVRLENIVNVPPEILTDIKILFGIIFLSFFVQTGLPNWDCGTYVTNRLDRTYIPNIFNTVLRAVLIVLMLTIFTPKVWYTSFATVVTTIIGLGVSWYNTHTLTPDLKVYLNPKRLICSWSAIKELVGSGIWNSISSVGNMLLSGLDLIICNVFIGATQMGVLSLSKTLPHLMQTLSASICNAFAPELIINYAKGDKEKVLKDINRSIKLTSVILIVPLSGIIVMSDAFYKLWVPSQDATLLWNLTVITCLAYAFTSGTQILYNVFATVNKVKTNALLMMLSGAISTLLVFILLNITNLGIFAIAGVSTVVCLVRNLIYTIPYASKYLGFKKTQFFPQVLACVTSTVILSVVGLILKSFFTITTWIEFFGVALLMGSIFVVISLFVFLKKSERAVVLAKVKRRFKRN